MEKWQLGRRLQNSFPEKENHVGTAGSGSYPRRDREAGDQGREEDWASVKVGAIRTRKSRLRWVLKTTTHQTLTENQKSPIVPSCRKGLSKRSSEAAAKEGQIRAATWFRTRVCVWALLLISCANSEKRLTLSVLRPFHLRKGLSQ